jgi:hypothetical protein
MKVEAPLKPGVETPMRHTATAANLLHSFTFSSMKDLPKSPFLERGSNLTM